MQAELESINKNLLKNKIEVTLSSSSQSATNLSSIPVNIKISEPVSDFTVDFLKFTNCSVTGFSGSGDSYSFNLIPTADGVVSISFPETKLVSTSTGKSTSALSSELVFTVDRVVPTVTLSSSLGALTNLATIPVSVVFSENVTGLSADDFAIQGGGAFVSSLTGSGQSYVLTLTANTPGLIDITLPLSAAYDVGGNGNYASNTLSINYDPLVPVPVLSSSASSQNNLSVISVTVDFGVINVSGLTASDFIVNNASV